MLLVLFSIWLKYDWLEKNSSPKKKVNKPKGKVSYFTTDVFKLRNEDSVSANVYEFMTVVFKFSTNDNRLLIEDIRSSSEVVRLPTKDAEIIYQSWEDYLDFLNLII